MSTTSARPNRPRAQRGSVSPVIRWPADALKSETSKTPLDTYSHLWPDRDDTIPAAVASVCVVAPERSVKHGSE